MRLVFTLVTQLAGDETAKVLDVPTTLPLYLAETEIGPLADLIKVVSEPALLYTVMVL